MSQFLETGKEPTVLLNLEFYGIYNLHDELATRLHTPLLYARHLHLIANKPGGNTAPVLPLLPTNSPLFSNAHLWRTLLLDFC